MFDLVRDADVILHAGDIVEQEVLDVLARHAPVHAVLGNNDPSLAGVLPERLEVELARVRIGMVHDSGQAKGRAERLHGMFPEADVVVFGHSHIPWDTRTGSGLRLLNPGSPTDRRRQPRCTMMTALADAGDLRDVALVPL